MFSILDDARTTMAQVEQAVQDGLLHPAAAAEWRINRVPAPPKRGTLDLFAAAKAMFNYPCKGDLPAD